MGGGVGVSAHGSHPRRHRHDEDGDARGGYRVHPRRRRHLHPVACTRTARPTRRADGGAVRRQPTRSQWASPTTSSPHDKLAEFKDAIVADGIDAALAAHATEPPASELLAQREWIDECFAGETVEDIVAALRGHDAGPANDAANLIMTRSPVSVSVALEAVRRAAKLDTLEDVLRQEYRTSCGSLRSHDLVEGIRAQVIDKDRNPKWSPPSLAAVTHADIEAYFAPRSRPRPSETEGEARDSRRATRRSWSTATSGSAPSH